MLLLRDDPSVLNVADSQETIYLAYLQQSIYVAISTLLVYDAGNFVSDKYIGTIKPLICNLNLVIHMDSEVSLFESREWSFLDIIPI